MPVGFVRHIFAVVSPSLPRMKFKRSFAVALLWLLIGCGIAGAQDDATPPDASESTAAQPAYDDVSQAGQIHGFIPETWSASMITLVDLQTQDGQDWLAGLTASQSVQGQTQYVCQNPGPTTTSSDTGDFYFYDLPAGSYVIAACMQTPDGHWRSGAQVTALEAGQNELVALGPSGGPIIRAGGAFVPAYYVGLWDPMWFGPAWGWGWRADAWQPSVYYRVSPLRSAPIWVRPAPIVVGARIVVPPYKDVVRGGYHYLGYRNGGLVRESPRTGILLPPKHEFHPITPEAEARMHAGTQVRLSGVAGRAPDTGSAGARPQATAPASPSPWTNYHPSTPVSTGVPNNSIEGSRGTVGTGNVGPQPRSNPQTPVRSTPPASEPRTATQSRPVQETAPRQEHHTPPSPPRQEIRAPQPTTQQKPAVQEKPAKETKKPY
jgi:hypothetical protein